MFTWFKGKKDHDLDLTDRAWKLSVLLVKLLWSAGKREQDIVYLFNKSLEWLGAVSSEQRTLALNTLRYLLKGKDITIDNSLKERIRVLFLTDQSLSVQLAALDLLGAVNFTPNPLEYLPPQRLKNLLGFRESLMRQKQASQRVYADRGVDKDVADELSAASAPTALRNVIQRVDGLDFAMAHGIDRKWQAMTALGLTLPMTMDAVAVELMNDPAIQALAGNQDFAMWQELLNFFADNSLMLQVGGFSFLVGIISYPLYKYLAYEIRPKMLLSFGAWKTLRHIIRRDMPAIHSLVPNLIKALEKAESDISYYNRKGYVLFSGECAERYNDIADVLWALGHPRGNTYVMLIKPAENYVKYRLSYLSYADGGLDVWDPVFEQWSPAVFKIISRTGGDGNSEPRPMIGRVETDSRDYNQFDLAQSISDRIKHAGMMSGLHTTTGKATFAGSSPDELVQLAGELWQKGIVSVFDDPQALSAFKVSDPEAIAGYFISAASDELPQGTDFVVTLGYFSPDDVRVFKAAHPDTAFINAIGKTDGDLLQLAEDTLAAGTDGIQLRVVSDFLKGNDFEDPLPEVTALRQRYPDLLIEAAGGVFGARVKNVLEIGLIPALAFMNAGALPAQAQEYQQAYAAWSAAGTADAAMKGGIDIQDIAVAQKSGGAKVYFNDAAMRAVMAGGLTGLKPEIISITPVQSPLTVMGALN